MKDYYIVNVCDSKCKAWWYANAKLLGEDFNIKFFPSLNGQSQLAVLAVVGDRNAGTSACC
jgi:hypothetical protein